MTTKKKNHDTAEPAPDPVQVLREVLGAVDRMSAEQPAQANWTAAERSAFAQARTLTTSAADVADPDESGK